MPTHSFCGGTRERKVGIMSWTLRGLDPMTGAHIYTDGPVKVLVSGMKERNAIGWHISVSCADRNPTWEEQKRARYEFVPDEVYMVQILPPKKEYVNRHPFCFHWHEAGPKFFDIKTGRPLP